MSITNLTSITDSKSLYKLESILFPFFSNPYSQDLVLFIGSGFSANFGLPTWDQLANYLMQEKVVRDRMSFLDLHMLNNDVDIHGKEKISYIFSLFAEDEQSEIDKTLRNKLNIKITPKNLEKGKDKVKHILEFINLFQPNIITTNADNILEKVLDLRKYQSITISNEKDLTKFTPDKGKKRPLYHIHGCVTDNSPLIFTYEKYSQRYRNKPFVDLLSRYMASPVIFLGYSLTDIEIFTILESKERDNNSFLFLDSFKYEHIKREIQKIKISPLGINLVPYYRDDYGYNALDKVFEIITVDYKRFQTDGVQSIINNNALRDVDEFKKLMDDPDTTFLEKNSLIHSLAEETKNSNFDGAFDQWKKS